MPDGFEWDATKSSANLAKHGISFDDAIKIFRDRCVERENGRHDYGEIRRVAIGRVADLLATVIYTYRGANRRIISARRANRDERKTYRAAYGD